MNITGKIFKKGDRVQSRSNKNNTGTVGEVGEGTLVVKQDDGSVTIWQQDDALQLEKPPQAGAGGTTIFKKGDRVQSRSNKNNTGTVGEVGEGTLVVEQDDRSVTTWPEDDALLEKPPQANDER